MRRCLRAELLAHTRPAVGSAPRPALVATAARHGFDQRRGLLVGTRLVRALHREPSEDLPLAEPQAPFQAPDAVSEERPWRPGRQATPGESPAGGQMVWDETIPLEQLWPLLSEAEGVVGPATAGEAFPFVPRPADDEACARALYVQDMESELTLALLANALPQLGADRGRDALLEKISSISNLPPDCSVEVLASIVRGLGAMLPDTRCETLLAKAIAELLNRKAKPWRHLVPLVMLLGRLDSSGKVVAPEMPVIRQANEMLIGFLGDCKAQGKEPDMMFSEVLACFEGLARIRSGPADAALDAAAGDLAAALAKLLRGGHGLKRQIAAARDAENRSDVLRLLAALWSLPEAAWAGGTAGGLATLPHIRWSRHTDGEEERTFAAAACMLARAGAWTCGAGFLLSRALARKSLTPEAGALWLCAIGQSGLALDKATDKPDAVLASRAEERLLACVDDLLASPTAAGRQRSLALAQALWGLCALKKDHKRDELLKALAELPAAQFPSAVWDLLLEVRQAMSSEENPLPEFQVEPWQNGIKAAAEAQAASLAASGRCEVLAAFAKDVGDEVTAVETKPALGPYLCALRATVGEQLVVLDFDGFESPVSRTLRRQQWESLAEGARVAEVPLSSWDSWDTAARAEVVRRRLLGIEDEAAGDDD